MNDDKNYKYRMRKARDSLAEIKGLGSRTVRCTECGHRIMTAFDDLNGHAKLYCNKCHAYRFINGKASSQTRKIRDSLTEPEGLSSRTVRCPECRSSILIAFDDLQGHTTLYCNKCHEYRTINVKYFRIGSKKRSSRSSTLYSPPQGSRSRT